jgi:hypothetical protein
MAFSPLPPTQIDDNHRKQNDDNHNNDAADDDDDDVIMTNKVPRSKVRQLNDDDDESNELSNTETAMGDSEQEMEEEDLDEQEANEELVDYKKQLFEMEAEESGVTFDRC